MELLHNDNVGFQGRTEASDTQIPDFRPVIEVIGEISTFELDPIPERTEAGFRTATAKNRGLCVQRRQQMERSKAH